MINLKIRKLLLKRCGGRCEAPGCMRLWLVTMPPHHIKYKSRGGSDKLENLAALCGRCHWMVHNRPWYTWTAKFRTHAYQQEGETEADSGVK